MSANDQINVVENEDGLWDIYYDPCVDNPGYGFKVSTYHFSNFDKAFLWAEEHENGDCPTEYGIRVIPFKDSSTPKPILIKEVDPELERLITEQEAIEAEYKVQNEPVMVRLDDVVFLFKRLSVLARSDNTTQWMLANLLGGLASLCSNKDKTVALKEFNEAVEEL